MFQTRSLAATGRSDDSSGRLYGSSRGLAEHLVEQLLGLLFITVLGVREL